MYSVLISEQTAIISLHSSNWSVFTIETQGIYSTVRTESLSTIRLQTTGLSFTSLLIIFNITCTN